jgi:hypothetical protein
MLKALVAAGSCGYFILDYWTDERRGSPKRTIDAWEFLFWLRRACTPEHLGIPDPRPKEPVTSEHDGFYIWEGTYKIQPVPNYGAPEWVGGAYRRALPDEVEAFSAGRHMGEQEDRPTFIPSDPPR